MTIFHEARISASVNKLRLFIAQISIQINIQRVSFEHHTVGFIVDFNFPCFENSRLLLIVNFTLDTVDEQLVGVLETARRQNLKA